MLENHWGHFMPQGLRELLQTYFSGVVWYTWDSNNCLLLLKRQEDVQLMKNLNMDAYRLSISWSRIFPGTYHMFTRKIIK